MISLLMNSVQLSVTSIAGSPIWLSNVRKVLCMRNKHYNEVLGEGYVVCK